MQEQLHGHDERDVKAKDRRAQAGLKFDALVSRGGDISKWERRAMEHDARQPFIRGELIAALEAQVCKGYRQLSRHVNGWCQPQTIERWLNSHPSYEVYRKNIKPGLTEVRVGSMCTFMYAIIFMLRFHCIRRQTSRSKWNFRSMSTIVGD